MIKGIKIWDIKGKYYFTDEDGLLVLPNRTAARNMMFTEGYSEEFVETGVEFHDHVEIDTDGYDYVPEHLQSEPLQTIKQKSERAVFNKFVEDAKCNNSKWYPLYGESVSINDKYRLAAIMILSLLMIAVIITKK